MVVQPSLSVHILKERWPFVIKFHVKLHQVGEKAAYKVFELSGLELRFNAVVTYVYKGCPSNGVLLL